MTTHVLGIQARILDMVLLEIPGSRLEHFEHGHVIINRRFGGLRIDFHKPHRLRRGSFAYVVATVGWPYRVVSRLTRTPTHSPPPWSASSVPQVPRSVSPLLRAMPWPVALPSRHVLFNT